MHIGQKLELVHEREKLMRPAILKIIECDRSKSHNQARSNQLPENRVLHQGVKALAALVPTYSIDETAA